MRRVSNLKREDRLALFNNTSVKCGMNAAIIEKDFWVCWMLDYLFHRSQWKNHFSFKGGTSLSKSYNLIERFSEDIDLILDWRVLGYGVNEPWRDRSNTKQDEFNKEAGVRTEIFLRNEFVPAIVSDLKSELSVQFHCYIDEEDPQTVIFEYPRGFDDTSVLPVIRLEIGVLAAWTPAVVKPVTSYAAIEYPRIFSEPSTDILTVLPERTFWEKATILHREAFRPVSGTLPSRYSRHYYDLYCMERTSVKDRALDDYDLLTRVAQFKDKFYHCKWARYDLAKRGTIRLIPPEYSIKGLKEDYEHMKNMIFGEVPEFYVMLKKIEELEQEVNEKRGFTAR